MTIPERSLDALARFDANQDHRITGAELRRLDTDGDGELSRAETRAAGIAAADHSTVRRAFHSAAQDPEAVVFDTEATSVQEETAPPQPATGTSSPSGNGLDHQVSVDGNMVTMPASWRNLPEPVQQALARVSILYGKHVAGGATLPDPMPADLQAAFADLRRCLEDPATAEATFRVLGNDGLASRLRNLMATTPGTPASEVWQAGVIDAIASRMHVYLPTAVEGAGNWAEQFGEAGATPNQLRNIDPFQLPRTFTPSEAGPNPFARPAEAPDVSVAPGTPPNDLSRPVKRPDLTDPDAQPTQPVGPGLPPGTIRAPEAPNRG